jgi:hypothetical protein
LTVIYFSDLFKIGETLTAWNETEEDQQQTQEDQTRKTATKEEWTAIPS